jgi:hypothetical protein
VIALVMLMFTAAGDLARTTAREIRIAVIQPYHADPAPLGPVPPASQWRVTSRNDSP